MTFLEEVYERMPDLRSAEGNLLSTLQAVSDFLESGDLRFAALRVLDTAMKLEIERRPGGPAALTSQKALLLETLRTYEKGALTDARWGEIQVMKPLTTHVLTNVLSRNEATWGFQVFQKSGYTFGQAVRLQGLLDADMFLNELLKKQRMWKDPGAGKAHGEFAHRIQWYMIMDSVQPPTVGWNNFYAWIGTKQPLPSIPYPSFGLWAALVDRPNLAAETRALPFRATSTQDFRSPEHLTEYLLADANKGNFEFLHAFCKSRYDKRDAEDRARDALSSDFLALGKIWSKRIYKVALDQLSRTDAIKLAETVYGILRNRPYIFIPQDPVKPTLDIFYRASGTYYFMEKINKLNKSNRSV